MELIKELTWRGMIHDIMPGTEEQLTKEITSAYVGFDPTADSLHIGNLVPVMLLKFLQLSGHKPIALVGGATGMIGDPSGKSAERQLLSVEDINFNLEAQKKQLEQFLDFDCGDNSAEIVNNYDWFKDINLLDFIRDTGKHITISYMMSKDSVKSRLESGMSFTEFTYQLIQGYDFLHLYENKNCKIQMGGSDQWGNIVTGTELIRRKARGEAFALTAPLIKKADGTKFGKSEGGNIWLDPKKTSPYKFYQYWLNSSDADVENFIKIFTLFDKETIDALIIKHNEDKGSRVLQKALGKDITCRVHSIEEYENAVKASEILFKKGQEAVDGLKSLSASLIQDIFEGVPQATFNKADLANGIDIVSALVEKGNFLKSNGEARRELKQNSISVNKAKVNDTCVLTEVDLIGGKYILLQKGKKNNYLVTVE
jgi:tyrosyl-tRNA synthetase